MAYGLRFAGNPDSIFPEDRQEGLCEAAGGLICEFFSSRQAAERSLRDRSYLSPDVYSIVPLPSYAGPETEYCDPEYHLPSITEHPAYCWDTHTIVVH